MEVQLRVADDFTEIGDISYRRLPRRRAYWRRPERMLEAQRRLYDAALEEQVDR